MDAQESGCGMTATEELRRLLDERGVEHYDGTNGTLWGKDASGYRFSADELTSGRMSVHMWCETPEQAVAATLGPEDAYTREDVEGAFVSGYSLGCLPAGSDPQWDQNEQTVDEHMAELGWVRKDAATLGQGTCRIELPGADYQCNGCGEIVGSADPTSELYIDGNAIEMWNYCPSCGRKVVA